MPDRMDDLLFSIGKEADDAVDYDALRSAVFASKTKAGKPRRAIYRTLSAAAALIVVVGAVSLYVRFQATGRNATEAQMKASVNADQEMLQAASQCTEESCNTAATPAEAPAPADAPMLDATGGTPSATNDMKAFGAMPENNGGTPSATSGMRAFDAMPENDGGTASDSDMTAYSSAMIEEDRVYVGIPSDDVLGVLERLGFTARYEDVENDLAEGEAYIAEEGSYAIWNTGSGMVSVLGKDGTREGILKALQGICE